jgi:hypothetical protein
VKSEKGDQDGAKDSNTKQPKDRGKLLWLAAKENDKLAVIIDLECEVQNISRLTLPSFMFFAIDVAGASRHQISKIVWQDY